MRILKRPKTPDGTSSDLQKEPWDRGAILSGDFTFTAGKTTCAGGATTSTPFSTAVVSPPVETH